MLHISDLIKRLVLLAVSLFLLTTFAFPELLYAEHTIVTGTWQGQTIEYCQGEIIIGLADGVVPADISQLLAQYQLDLVTYWEFIDACHVVNAARGDIFPIIENLVKSELIAYAEPNGIFYTYNDPNDPFYLGTPPAGYAHQWALNNTGQNPPSGQDDADIDAPEAWDHETGDSDVLIAVFDSGIPTINGLLSHPDLDDTTRFIYNDSWDWSPPPLGTPPGPRTAQDQYGHGTHVTGIIGAETNNNEGIAGLCQECSIKILKILNRIGAGSAGAFIQAMFEIQYSSANERIINFSGGTYSENEAQAVESAVKWASEAGILQVYPTGNNNTIVGWPARFAFEGNITG